MSEESSSAEAPEAVVPAANPVEAAAADSPLDAAADKGPLAWTAPEDEPQELTDTAALNDATEQQDLIAFRLRT
jgi:hypothetical protein